MKQSWQQRLGLDLRSLAAFRMGIALLILLDLFLRAGDLSAHYTDAGVLPRDAVFELRASDLWLSLHHLSGSAWMQSLLFGIAAVFALMLLAGYRTRLATVISWVLLISLQNRNTMVLDGGDVMLRVLLFWGMFLPLGRAWSLDALYWQKREEGERRVLGFAGMALLLQVVMIYFFSALQKTGAEWHADGSAIWCALQLDQFTKPLGRWLSEAPRGFLEFLTHFVYWFELLGAMLLFIPWRREVWRLGAALAFMLFHVGLGLTFSLGLFPLIGVVAWLPFLPGGVWTWLGKARPLQSANNRFQSGLSFLKKSLRALILLLPHPAQLPQGPWRESLLQKAFLSLMLLYVLLWNLDSLPATQFGMEKHFAQIGDLTRMDQTWTLFAPKPWTEDGWFYMPGTLANGKKVDLFHYLMNNEYKENPSREKPEDVSTMFRSSRWHKYLMNIWLANKVEHRYWLASYLCKQWNAAFGAEQQLATFNMNYELEEVTSVGKKKVKDVLLWTHSCE